jgi:glycosyltransferase involved in cell wall biosynthesis
MRILFWGTYDIGKPRVRILLRGLRENGIAVHECHANVWSGVEDKSQLSGIFSKLSRMAKWLSSYPRLIWWYFNAPAHDIVLVPYLGHLDIFVLWPFAKLRGARIMWDAFISLYNTVVEDRRLISERHPVAWLIYTLEWLATRAADRVLLDTSAHADYFARRYSLPRHRLSSVFVGAEPEQFPPLPPLAPKGPSEPLIVLFYGQFIPLHGVPTIIDAARHLDDGSIYWVLVGKGQEEVAVRESLARDPVENLEWHPWVPYEELVKWIGRADVCLGIFSASEKAAQVIPNKAFQVISAGRPLITRDSPAIRELFKERAPGVYFVAPENAQALVDAVRQFAKDRPALIGARLYYRLGSQLSPKAIGKQLLGELMNS